MMKTTGIKELRSSLAATLERVKGGEQVLITERGEPVASGKEAPPGLPWIRPGRASGGFKKRLTTFNLLKKLGALPKLFSSDTP